MEFQDIFSGKSPLKCRWAAETGAGVGCSHQGVMTLETHSSTSSPLLATKHLNLVTVGMWRQTPSCWHHFQSTQQCLCMVSSAGPSKANRLGPSIALFAGINFWRLLARAPWHPLTIFFFSLFLRQSYWKAGLWDLELIIICVQICQCLYQNLQEIWTIAVLSTVLKS